MKKTALSIALMMALAATAFSQAGNEGKEKEKVKVPAAVEAAFAKSHAGVTAEWEKEKNKDAYEAEFEKDGKKTSVVYSAAGALLETEVEIPVAELPAAVTAYISTHYKGVKVKEAARITDAKGTVTYEAEVKDKDLVFDANGNLLTPTK